MAKPNKDGKTLVQFNVKDAVYSVEGETASVKPLTYMNTFTKDRNISVKNIYGDGELQDSLYSDKSITGAIGTTARDMDFEKGPETLTMTAKARRSLLSTYWNSGARVSRFLGVLYRQSINMLLIL